MRQPVRDFLNTEVSDWYLHGVIDSKTRDLLAIRYERSRGALGLIIKWLGLFALFCLGSTLLSFVAIAAHSKEASAVLLLLTSGMMWYFGVKLVRKVPVSYSFTGSVLITTALGAFYGELCLLAFISTGGEPETSTMISLVYVVIVAALITAYLYRLRWPLILALILFFHVIGSGEMYAGSGAYIADIVDERRMAFVAAAAILLGVFHEYSLEENFLKGYEGFGRLYIIFGLIYFNCALWFLSLHHYWSYDFSRFDSMLLFTAACLGQILLGARIKDDRFTGFGIVFLSIDMYTRFFESYWDQLSAGAFFSIAGGIALIGGYFFERRSYSSSKREALQ